MKRRNNGFTLVEILIICLLVSVVFLTLLTLYTTSLNDATHSRQRLLATLVAESSLAEISDHSYGTPKPDDWGVDGAGPADIQSFPMVVEGRPVKAEVHRRIGAKGGSFFGQSTSSSDTVTIQIQWWDPTVTDDNMQELSAEIDVTRDPDLQLDSQK